MALQKLNAQVLEGGLALDIDGNMTLTGNLTAQGTTTTVQSTTVNINDNMLSLADNQTGTDTDAVDIGFYGNFIVTLTKVPAVPEA